MKVTKYILEASVLVILIGSIVGGALAKGGGGGGGRGGGGEGGRSGGGGGGRSGGGMHASSGMHSNGGMRNGGMSSSMYRSGGMSSSVIRSGGMSGSMHHSSGGPSSQVFASRSSQTGSFARGGDGSGYQSFSRESGKRGFGNHELGNHDSGNHGADRQFSQRGSDHGRNGNYDRLVAFMNDKGDGRNGGRGNMGHDGDFRQRFAGNDRFDHNGDNFRHNADSIRRDFHDRDRNDIPFRSGWWDHRRFDRGFGPWGFAWWRGNPWYWWGWTTAPYLDSWLAFGWDQPCYWDYGPGAYVYYNYPTNKFYQDNKPYQPASTYYQQVYDLAHSAPAVSQDDAAKSDWLPLGVFAMTKENRKDENWTFQLGVNKQGVLSGTYFNQANDAAHPLAGMVDKATHKAAWYFADGSNEQMVFETSVDNLTEPQSTVMVHFGPGDVGVWQLVRLERPEASQNQTPESLPTPPQHDLP